MKTILILSLVIFLSGCGASLKDFQQMTKSERTTKTCSSDSMVRQYKNKKQDYQYEINQIEDLLMDGYKTIENCSTATIRDERIKDTKKRVITKCYNQNIPLTNYATNKYEQRLNNLVSLLEEARLGQQRSYLNCQLRVKELTAEQAYLEYKN